MLMFTCWKIPLPRPAFPSWKLFYKLDFRLWKFLEYCIRTTSVQKLYALCWRKRMTNEHSFIEIVYDVWTNLPGNLTYGSSLGYISNVIYSNEWVIINHLRKSESFLANIDFLPQLKAIRKHWILFLESLIICKGKTSCNHDDVAFNHWPTRDNVFTI